MAKDTLTVVDNRTGKGYELPIQDGTVRAADRIRARTYPLVCPSVVMEQEGHPSPYGDAGADAPERLKSIMIAHQAA